MAPNTSPIFPPWDFSQWVEISDRIRGGSSHCSLEPIDLGPDSVGSSSGARLSGHLDTKTLGGAGFASQRYRFGPEALQLPRVSYRGISLQIVPIVPSSKAAVESGVKAVDEFTLVVKSSLPQRQPKRPKHPTDPDPAVISYEATFMSSPPRAPSGDKVRIDFTWDAFTPTFRGKEIKREDPKYQPLKSETIYELSMMCRSGFGKQEGDFEVVLLAIEGWAKDEQVRMWSEWWSGLWEGVVGWMRSWWRDERGVRLQDDEKANRV